MVGRLSDVKIRLKAYAENKIIDKIRISSIKCIDER